MDLAAINAFVAVGDRKGFRAAATVLDMTSAGVSKAVARLETQLGVGLVARTTRSVRLTPAGIAFHARCKAILADLEDAGRQATDDAALPQGRVVVSVSRTFGRLRVLPVVADCLRQYPQVDVEVRFSDRPVDLVAESVDMAVRIGHLPDSGLVASRVGETRFVLCGSPEYLAATHVPTHPDQLKRHVVVGYVVPGTAVRFPYRFLIDGEVRTLTMPSRLTVDDGEALVGAATRSAGLVMVNDYLVERELRDGRLVRVLQDFEMPPLPISTLRLPTRVPSAAMQVLGAMLRRRLVDTFVPQS